MTPASRSPSCRPILRMRPSIKDRCNDDVPGSACILLAGAGKPGDQAWPRCPDLSLACLGRGRHLADRVAVLPAVPVSFTGRRLQALYRYLLELEPVQRRA